MDPQEVKTGPEIDRIYESKADLGLITDVSGLGQLPIYPSKFRKRFSNYRFLASK
jgi:hypothetical protein